MTVTQILSEAIKTTATATNKQASKQLPAAKLKTEKQLLTKSEKMSDSDSDNSGGEEDERMKQLLASWDDDNSDDSSDSSDDEEDEEEEDQPKAGATKFDLNLEDNVLDHIVIAAPDFQEALKEFENMTGIKVSHPDVADRV